jgi:hypothetical protein
MTTTAIRKKVHKYIDEADKELLEAMSILAENYIEYKGSLLTEEQKAEVINRSKLYREGKMKAISYEDFKKKLKRK